MKVSKGNKGNIRKIGKIPVLFREISSLEVCFSQSINKKQRSGFKGHSVIFRTVECSPF